MNKKQKTEKLIERDQGIYHSIAYFMARDANAAKRKITELEEDARKRERRISNLEDHLHTAQNDLFTRGQEIARLRDICTDRATQLTDLMNLTRTLFGQIERRDHATRKLWERLKRPVEEAKAAERETPGRILPINIIKDELNRFITSYNAYNDMLREEEQLNAEEEEVPDTDEGEPADIHDVNNDE